MQAAPGAVHPFCQRRERLNRGFRSGFAASSFARAILDVITVITIFLLVVLPFLFLLVVLVLQFRARDSSSVESGL